MTGTPRNARAPLFDQMDVNNDGTVDWEEMSSFMVDMGMRGWAESVVSLPTYSYAGQVDGAQPTLAADQVCRVQ